MLASQEQTDLRVVRGAEFHPAGRLVFTRAAQRQFSIFTPSGGATEWSFLSPYLDGAPVHASGQADARDALPGFICDAAPDSWGRRLLDAASGRSLDELEYLLAVSDDLRQGALRFLDATGTPASPATTLGIAALPRLAELARRHEAGETLHAQEYAVLAAAGGALGGARPKLSLRAEGSLWVAKLTSLRDEAPVERMEVATLELARLCGLDAPEARLEMAGPDHPVALIRRFDRRGLVRIPYVSARTALGRKGIEPGSYSEIADVLRHHGSEPEKDMRELYRRVLFTILVSNRDDHLRNHGLLHDGKGWRLAPLFDVNPAPEREGGLKTSILEGEAPIRDIDAALEGAFFFCVGEAAAAAMARDMAQTISASWRRLAQAQGVVGAQARAYAPAFEHEDARRAAAL